MKKSCKEIGCFIRYYAKDLCVNHYAKQRRKVSKITIEYHKVYNKKQWKENIKYKTDDKLRKSTPEYKEKARLRAKSYRQSLVGIEYQKMYCKRPNVAA